MPTIPGPVDDNGNILVPAGGGVTIPIKEQAPTSPFAQIDIHAIPMTFVVQGRISKSVPVDPADALGKLLTITETEADSLSAKQHSFQLLDMTDPLVPVPVWTGKIWRLT